MYSPPDRVLDQPNGQIFKRIIFGYRNFQDSVCPFHLSDKVAHLPLLPGEIVGR